MQKFGLALAGLLVLGLIGAAVVWFTGEGENQGLETDGLSDVVEDSSDGRIRRRRSDMVAVEDQAEVPGAGETISTDDAVGDGGYVLVLDEFGAAVVGARVELSRAEDRRRRDGFSFFDATADQAARAFHTSTSDEAGRVLLPRLPEGEVRVVARKDKLHGTAAIGETDAPNIPAEAETVVTLRPVKQVTVQLIGPSGGPVPHVLVSVTTPGGGDRGGRGGRRGGRGGRGGRGMNNFSSWADEDGLAKFEITADRGNLYGAERVEVRAQLVGLERESKEVRLLDDTDTEVLLQLPATGSVELTLLDENSRVFEDRTRVMWTVNLEEGDGAFWEMFSKSPFGTRLVRGGKIVVGGFMPGANVTFDARHDDRMPGKEVVDLPSVGGRHRVSVALGPPRPFLEVTLLEPDGKPSRRERYTFSDNGLAESEQQTNDDEADGGGRRGRRGGRNPMMRMMRRFMNDNVTERTDKTGRVRVPLRSGATRVEIESTDRRWRRAFGGGRRGRGNRGGDNGNDGDAPLAVVELPMLDPGQVYDAGEVELDRGSLLVAGRIVDSKDAPVAKANLRVRTERIETDASNADGGGRRNRRRGGRGGWGGQTVRSEDDGTFRIYAEPDADVTYTIVAERDHLSEPVSFAPGDSDVVVRALETGGLRGSITYAEPALRVNPDVRVRHADDAENDRAGWRRARLKDDGTFEARNLKPGLYELRARLDGITAAEVTGLIVESGDTSAPGPIQGLVVGANLQAAEVVVVEPNGTPFRGARVTLETAPEPDANDNGGRRRGGRGGRGNRTDSEGKIRRVVERGSIASVKIRADGYPEQSIDAPTFPLRVVLEPGGARLIVSFGAPLPDLEEVRSYQVVVYSPEADLTGGGFERMRFRKGSRRVDDGKDRVTIANLVEGSYRIGLEIRPNIDFRSALEGATNGTTDGNNQRRNRRNRRNLRQMFGGAVIDLGEVKLGASGDQEHAVSIGVADVQEALAATDEPEDGN